MECKNIQNLLIDFIEGNIQANIKAEIEEHLLSCKNCRTEHRQLQEILMDMNELEDENPGEQLKMDFYSMLENEKELNKKENKEVYLVKKTSFNWNYFKYAASIIVLLGIGFILGTRTRINTERDMEIAQLRSELNSIQHTATLASLSQPTASQRLNAINIINNQLKPDEKTITVLLNTFRYDENTNVRMAAAQALAKYPENNDIKEAYLEVLENDENPALQITLINLLTQFQEARAKKAFEKIIQNENTMPVVKQQAEQGLKVFI